MAILVHVHMLVKLVGSILDSPISCLKDVSYVSKLFQKVVGNRPRWPDSLIMQHPIELAQMLCYLDRFHIESYLEIGVWYGGNFYATTAYLKRTHPEFKMAHAVDPQFCVKQWEAVSRLLPIEFFKQSSQRFKPTRRYDFVFIDGDHRYKLVKGDFDKFSKVSKICAIHDIQNTDLWKHEVRLYWNKELKIQYPDHKQFAVGKGLGIGMVFPRNFLML